MKPIHVVILVIVFIVLLIWTAHRNEEKCRQKGMVYVTRINLCVDSSMVSKP